jgi:glucosamine-6-phosphate deaminase
MHLLRFDSLPAWVSAVCALWRDRLRMNPELKICLPTGLTPAAVYAELARNVDRGDVSFTRASVFALDEFGGLPSDDPGLTRNTLRRQLVSLVDLPLERFHCFDPNGADIGEQCRRYDTAIGRFDLVLLGIGLNGHLGMNEPGSDAGSPTRRADLHETTIQSSARYFDHGNLPRWGITVGLAPILAAREVWLLATGTAKASVARETVKGEVGLHLPASLLRNHPNCSFFLDSEAGALL